jgi:oligopeptide transport system substrate-binding protein
MSQGSPLQDENGSWTPVHFQGSNDMKTRLNLAFLLRTCMLVALAVSASALGGAAAAAPSGPDSYWNPLTVNVNLGGEPLTVDPALWEDTTSANVIEQLFIGLVDLDDETAEPVPELATSWTVSPNGLVYNFTLRSDALWTDGRVITAGDVRYGILRSLNPATASPLAFELSIIKNAEGYNNGSITDPNQVGVKALDDTHLEITLEHPASYVLSILAMPVARPMPQWAIDAWGTAWTDPAHIVTSGPYRLKEWVHGDHITLEKYWQFWADDQVQIERINAWMVDEATAWSKYLAGDLDTVPVPLSATLTPELLEQVHMQPGTCNYYYGFSLSQAPFNQLLVRQAFAAATNRQGLVDTVLHGVPEPALTFTPPGIFGHVDGAAEGVGIPYDPTQAQAWLAAAGYPGGAGLPPITLWYNTGASHQAIAQYIADNWQTDLGVNVSLSSLAWPLPYLDELEKGTMQVWRLGWCMDYPDAYNFLHDGLEPRSKFGNWNNASYDSLLNQALSEPDPDARKALYKQAEEILVETDAVLIPLYYTANVIATKPYLERTYPVGGQPDVATWRISTSATIEAATGGTLTSHLGDTVIDIPANAIANVINITISSVSRQRAVGPVTGIGHMFDVTAVFTPSGDPAVLEPGKTYNLTVYYTDQERGPVKEDTLALYSWDGANWVKEPSSVVNGAANTVNATPDHFSLWAVLGETKVAYLPLVLRN